VDPHHRCGRGGERGPPFLEAARLFIKPHPTYSREEIEKALEWYAINYRTERSVKGFFRDLKVWVLYSQPVKQ